MKVIISIVFFLIAQSALFAQENNVSSVIFNHVALSVEDVDRSAEFYKEILGLKEITNRTEQDGIRWLSLGGDVELHLISVLKEEFKINKAIHFAITTPDFTQFVEDLEARGITYSNWPGSENTISNRADGIKQIYVQDPDGHWIEVNSTAEKK